MGAIITPILQMRTPSHRADTYLAQDYTVLSGRAGLQMGLNQRENHESKEVELSGRFSEAETGNRSKRLQKGGFHADVAAWASSRGTVAGHLGNGHPVRLGQRELGRIQNSKHPVDTLCTEHSERLIGQHTTLTTYTASPLM